MSESKSELMSVEQAAEKIQQDPTLHPDPDFVAYLKAYPETPLGYSVRRAATYDSLDRFERGAAGGFENELWAGGREAATNSHASAENTRRLEKI